ncbi:MAG TPA: hypothetical protein VET66_14065 [Steroidobacteraceae bacterium]|nr:hypothetical protein [Steroidobacteraceae bacterium]
MEAASRPPLEPLSDLPVEEPLDTTTPRQEPQAAAAAPAAAQPDPTSLASKSPEQTGLNFVDPEMFLATGKYPTIVPVEEPAKPPEPPPGLELELEDPVVDVMLTAPPPPKPTVAPTPAVTKTEATPAAREERSTRVPIAKTASLSAAATKLAAAAGQRTVSKSAAVAATARPLPAKDHSAREADAAAKAGAAKDVAPQPAPKDTGHDAAPAAATDKGTAAAAAAAKEVKEAKEAPSLASWASARAAASPAVKPGTPSPKPNAAAAIKRVSSAPRSAAVPTAAPAAPPRAAAAKSVAAAPPAAHAPAHAPSPPPAANTPLPAAPMDRDFIARNQVVERYLSGRLPLKGATDFERFCHDHPELLDAIGLPERVNAGLRLLEAAGKPEPWQEAPRPLWQKPAVTLALAATAAVFGIGLAIATGTATSRTHKVAELQKQLTEQALDPATSTRSIRLMPSRSGASNAPAIVIGGGKAELADLKIDESRSQYYMFRVTIDRIDQGRVGVITNLAKDSNGHLRIALNSSALGPGNYQLTLEGLDRRGDPQPDSWITIGVAR